jgi:hypothetical protein
MRKKYFVILAVIMILATAIFMHLRTKEKQDLKSHHEQEYMRIIEAARKSPHAGLAQMGQALNRYYEKTKSYPPELEALYPDYIPVRAYITDIEWGYRKQGDNFYLSKSIALGNQTMVAAIDKSLSPLNTKDSLLASKSNANRLQKPSPLSSSRNTVPGVSAQMRSAIDSAGDRTGANLQNLPPRSASGSSAARIEKSSPAVKESPVAGPEVIAVQEVKEKEKSLCEKEGGYLVWRSKDGSIGFSNVQYPQQDQITIYDSGMWVKIKHRNAGAAAKSQNLLPAAEPSNHATHIAEASSEGYLLWKDQKGNIGFSNVQYPEREQVAQIWLNGSWFAYNK